MDAEFAEYLLPDPLMRGLVKAGFETPTPVQAQVIPRAIDGLDLLVSAVTGSGKTAAFLIPVIQRFLDVPRSRGGTRALILTPTRELARQILDHFLRLASYTRLRAEVITGGDSRAHQVAALRKNPEILVATPGRLLELVEGLHADLSDLELLVLDEADRMLDMGFAEDVLSIIGATPSRRQSLLFSATLDHRGLKRITDSLLRDPEVLVIDPVRAPHPSIRHRVILSDDRAQKRHQLLWLLQNEPFDKALVFANTREDAAELGSFLQTKGRRAAVLHGELSQRERNRIMGLLHAGRVDVVVATDLAARGLDVPGMQLVVNFDVPRSGSDYVHRTGRTGRAGDEGLAIALVGPPEWNRMESITRYLGLEPQSQTIDGLKARFQGHSRRKGAKSSTARKRTAPAAQAKDKPKKKDRLRDRKNIGKRRQPTGRHAVEAGHAPLQRKAEPAKNERRSDSTDDEPSP